MTFAFSEKGKVKVDLIYYMDAMVDNFSTKFKPYDTAPKPAAEDLLEEGTSDELYMQQAAEYYTFVAKVLLACNISRSYIGPIITALCTCMKNPNQNYLKNGLHN